MCLKCEWRHARKRWAENLRILKNTAVELTLDDVGRQLCCLPLRKTNEGVWQLYWEVEFRPWCSDVGIRPWCWEILVRPWYWEVEVRLGSWDFEVVPWKTIVEFLPLEHRVGYRPLNDFVSIVWLRKTFKNCLSPRVEKRKSEVNKTVPIWTTESSLLYLRMYIYCCYWYNYGCEYTIQLIKIQYLDG